MRTDALCTWPSSSAKKPPRPLAQPARRDARVGRPPSTTQATKSRSVDTAGSGTTSSIKGPLLVLAGDVMLPLAVTSMTGELPSLLRCLAAASFGASLVTCRVHGILFFCKAAHTQGRTCPKLAVELHQPFRRKTGYISQLQMGGLIKHS